jgi:hypothetical protein
MEDTNINKILTLSTGSLSPSSLTSSPNSISSSKPSSTNVTVSLIRTAMRNFFFRLREILFYTEVSQFCASLIKTYTVMVIMPFECLHEKFGNIC